MGNYTEIFYHFVWATKRREPYLTPIVEPFLHDFIRHKCNSLRATVYAVNGMPDHVHLACSLPLSLAASEFLEIVKGSSSHFINNHPELRHHVGQCLYWQQGVGALTYNALDLPRIIKYIDHQKRHHKLGRLSPKMERCDDGFSSAPKGVSSA